MRKMREERLKAALDLPEAEGRPCDAPGCREPGQHRAPKARDRLQEHFWFCLGHVREYNLAWDYYRGMTPEEIEWHVQQDVQWRRPVWPLGGRGSTGRFDDAVHDTFGLFDESDETGGTRRRDERYRAAEPRTPEEQALGVLDLDSPASFDHIKARYKELVKRLHPDANGGDKVAEEKLKLVNQAYATLRSSALAR